MTRGTTGRGRTFTYRESHFECYVCGLYTVGMVEYGGGHGYESSAASRKALLAHLRTHDAHHASQQEETA